jgi:hypothetical protein
LLIEAELLLDWYLPRLGAPIDEEARATFRTLWREALTPSIEEPPTWVLRDYHSPNLLWLPERHELRRVGLLDFQDALMGPRGYDLASILQDARIDVRRRPSWRCLAVTSKAGAPGSLNSTDQRLSGATSPSRPSAPARSWGFSPGSTPATANRNICDICRAYGAICSAPSPTRPRRSSKNGIANMYRR